jgi:hypothetical protein
MWMGKVLATRKRYCSICKKPIVNKEEYILVSTYMHAKGFHKACVLQVVYEGGAK